MPSRGLSLVGFFDKQRQALDHFRNFCIHSDPSEAALLREWTAARARIGAPVARAGVPESRAIGPPHDEYIQQLQAQSWVKSVLERPDYRGAEFKLIEIGPLLAHQPVLHVDRCDQVCAVLKSPTVAALIPVCLPLAQPRPLDPPSVIVQKPESVIIKSRDLQIEALTPSMMTVSRGGYEHVLVGMEIRWSLPFVHVVRFNGRHYLLNGYHRVLGAAKRGATYVPCLLREWRSSDVAGGSAEPEWLLMPRRLLESPNPPTLAHYLQDRAHTVMLRATSRILHVSWSHYFMPDEYEGIKR